MKKLFGFVIVCVSFLSLSAFIISGNDKSHNTFGYSKKILAGTIEGTIEPGENAKRVWAISSSDSVEASPAMGKFSIPVKAGTWKIIVEAAAPYKDAIVDNVVAEEGKSTNVGVIKLTQ